MWQQLSLRSRLLFPLGAVFLAALLLGAVLLRFFATTQLIEEMQPAARSAEQVAIALNAALRSSANSGQTLDAFSRSLGTGGAIQFRAAGAAPVRPPVRPPWSLGKAPAWFADLLSVPEIGATYPVSIDGSRVGEIVFAPDISADIYEKWIGFMAIAVSGIGLALLTGIIAYFIVGAALRPLRDLAAGLTRIRDGDYGKPVVPAGPPEIRKSCEEVNELSRTLSRLSQDNRDLLRRIVSLQDDDRRELARELHDELGPLLFGIRANTVALLDAVPDERVGFRPSAQGVVQSVEALQQANRRILERLRPLHIHELGLIKSIETLLGNARSQAPQIELQAEIDPQLAELDGLLCQTAYRVIQEGITNVLRHANAGSINVKAAVEAGELLLEISDDGVGFPEGHVFGRGLTGMRERVRALGGTFELLRERRVTSVRCRLPVSNRG
ncbi:MAG: two-component system, NarL family, sensor histidine kinase UhpB [Bradyrhizobium sp.]|jgi:two-component system sensor histidine kinase UhpB|nr:two-component system, NarL family, sensor histidine kinase UhpB [Bradyrhizobium sp.]